jgi:uncharacterized protein
MPWSPSSAKSFTSKADTPKKQRAWAAAANAALKKYGSESRAVRVANAVVANMTEDARKRRYGQSRDRFGRELTSWEEFAELELDAMFKQPLVVIMDAPAPVTRMMYDAVEIDDAAKVSFTADGYMKAQPRIARTGLQKYLGIECGRPEMDTVMVYRPENSVFHNDAMHSYSHLPITVDHPRSMVNADSWKKHAVGETGDEVVRDGGSVRVPMMLRDSKAIELVKSGKRQLSVGYACDLQWQGGYTADGEHYDAVQTNIRGNHLAIVTEARGGPLLTIGDSTMTEQLRTVLIDGLPIELKDRDATIVQRTLTNLTDAFEAFKKKAAADDEETDKKCDAMAKDLAAKDTEVKTKDALILTLQTQLKDATDPAKLDAQLAVRDIVRMKAVAIMGPTFKADGRKIEDVMRDVVTAKSGVGDAAKTWGDPEVKAVFDHLTAGLQSAPRDPIRDASHAFSGPGPAYSGQSVKDAAYAEMVKDMENAWKTKPTAIQS